MKADPYHPDWQRYVGNEPRAVGADVVRGSSLPEIKMVDGFYQAEGTPFKFSEYYYNRLWSTGRGAPFVQADEVLKTATTVTPG